MILWQIRHRLQLPKRTCNRQSAPQEAEIDLSSSEDEEEEEVDMDDILDNLEREEIEEDVASIDVDVVVDDNSVMWREYL
ncbi:hypothetical protein QE152_g35162 [Popillia japonica]|uniref:Uncharacterized protein n=1 Tax=Popillia japonica TaxID=7064 RepID=A0AAW1IR04_POPJA